MKGVGIAGQVEDVCRKTRLISPLERCISLLTDSLSCGTCFLPAFELELKHWLFLSLELARLQTGNVTPTLLACLWLHHYSWDSWDFALSTINFGTCQSLKSYEPISYSKSFPIWFCFFQQSWKMHWFCILKNKMSIINICNWIAFISLFHLISSSFICRRRHSNFSEWFCGYVFILKFIYIWK